MLRMRISPRLQKLFMDIKRNKKKLVRPTSWLPAGHPHRPAGRKISYGMSAARTGRGYTEMNRFWRQDTDARYRRHDPFHETNGGDFVYCPAWFRPMPARGRGARFSGSPHPSESLCFSGTGSTIRSLGICLAIQEKMSRSRGAAPDESAVNPGKTAGVDGDCLQRGTAAVYYGKRIGRNEMNSKSF